jgi:hypothetical protein
MPAATLNFIGAPKRAPISISPLFIPAKLIEKRGGKFG